MDSSQDADSCYKAELIGEIRGLVGLALAYSWKKGHLEALCQIETLLKSIKIERSSKTLVILDLNGVLIDREFGKDLEPEESVSYKVGNFLVWKRPGLDAFLTWLFYYCDVAVWSSVSQFNLDQLVRFVFDNPSYHFKELKFIWGQEMCDSEPHPDPAMAKKKPLFVKNLAKVWSQFPQYDSKNTIIIDDTKEKVRNAKLHICPLTWSHADGDDEYLSDGLLSAAIEVLVEFRP